MEARLLLQIQQFFLPYTANFWVVVTHLGDHGTVWILLGVVLLLRSKTRRWGWTVLVALLLSLIINNGILKHLFMRARPFDVMKGLQLLISPPTDFSMPSGHTGSSFAAATGLVLASKNKWSCLACVLALAIGFSRLVVGAHYPSDVMVGMISGCLCGWLADVLVRRFLKNEQ